MSSAMPAAVAVEFGFGSAPDAVSPTWTDVTAHVLVSDGITIEPGRTAERSSISPRRLSFTLDNRDGRFDPQNGAGPHFGDLVPRVPVRVRVTYSAVTYTLFRGFVEGGWPQDFGEVSRTVPITAVDAVGWAAQCPPPRSAFEGEVAALREVEGATLLGWLRSQSDGWRDHVTGHQFPHTAKLEKLDPLVDGDEESGWGTVTDRGVGVDRSTKLNAPLFTAGSPGLFVAWLRWENNHTAGDPHEHNEPEIWIEDDGATPDVLRCKWWDNNGEQFFHAEVRNGTGGCRVYELPWVTDGAVQMVAVWSDGGSTRDRIRVWCGTDELPGGFFDPQSAAGTGTGCAVLGGLNAATLLPTPPWSEMGIVTSPWAGCVDHIQWWTDTDGWGCTVEEAVTRLFEAGRLARVGDSMAGRMSWLLDACGWSHVGTLDASQIVTQQGYRRRNTVLELLQTIEDTEQGRIWVDNEGRWRFSARSWPTTDARSSTVQATFGDVGTDLPFAAALSRIVDDDRLIVNVAEVTREYGTQQRSENAASIAAYGRRQPVTLSNLLYANDRQSKAVADQLVAVHGEPQARVEVLTFHPANEPATLCPLAGQIEPGWLIRTKRDGLTLDAHVVDVGHRIGLTWEVSLHLDATRATDFTGFTWDDGTGTVGTPWDDGTGTTTGAKGWVF